MACDSDSLSPVIECLKEKRGNENDEVKPITVKKLTQRAK